MTLVLWFKSLNSLYYIFHFFQREKKDNPNRGNVNPRKIRTRKDQWEQLKMGPEFVDAKAQQPEYGSPDLELDVDKTRFQSYCNRLLY